ncbi:MAG TPA: phage major capsid protein [Brevundimonas sp.]|jgi:HK97 family phage major capsid protein|uniref:phage major capsid protein n=1 Tax=Brevundimonas sp. TaxID=1871086 RepID=UPI002DF15402|nr:phage major capsid protein [Brevundimonas sp.]
MNTRTACLASAAPRALRGPVRAQTPVAEAIAQITNAFDQFKDKNESRWDAAQRTIDDLNARIAAGSPSGAGMTTLTAPDPEYSGLFASWFRRGDQEAELKQANATGTRQAVQAAMSAGTDGAGGYLAPVEWDRRVNKALVPVSPMRRLARIVPTTVRAYSTLYSKDGWGSGWVGETAARPATTTPTLDPLIFPHGEIYANPGITQNLLDDADFNLEAWLADEVAEEFAKQEGIAFISGNGTNKPRGLLTYVTGGASDDHHPGGNLTVVLSGAASALPNADGLIDFVYGLSSPYRQNAKWLMNSMTAAAIAKFKDGDGNYLWRETYVAGQPATLLGYAVEIDQNMPDVGAGAIPIAFGDFQRGYVINDRQGVRVLRDPYTNKPYVHFYTTKRVGGGVDDPQAIRLLKIAAS